VEPGRHRDRTSQEWPDPELAAEAGRFVEHTPRLVVTAGAGQCQPLNLESQDGSIGIVGCTGDLDRLVRALGCAVELRGPAECGGIQRQNARCGRNAQRRGPRQYLLILVDGRSDLPFGTSGPRQPEPRIHRQVSAPGRFGQFERLACVAAQGRGIHRPVARQCQVQQYLGAPLLARRRQLRERGLKLSPRVGPQRHAGEGPAPPGTQLWNQLAAPRALRNRNRLGKERGFLAMCGRPTGTLGRPCEIAERALMLFGPDSMMRQQVEQFVGPLAGGPLDPVGDLTVQPAPVCARQHLVGHIADQIVLEDILTIATEPRLWLLSEQIVALQCLEVLRDIPIHTQGGQAAEPAMSPEHRRARDDLPLLRP
jgi:hypothetical protein